MYIDTKSREGMEKSIAVYLDVSVDELYQYIDFAAEKAQQDQCAFNTDIFFDELETIISDLQPELEIPNLDFESSGANVITFTKRRDEGRYGFLNDVY